MKPAFVLLSALTGLSTTSSVVLGYAFQSPRSNEDTILREATAPWQPVAQSQRHYQERRKLPSCCEEPSKKVIREDANCPELAREALLKLRNLPGSRSTRSLVTFEILLPFMHGVLDKLREWQNPLGQAYKAFDDALATVQEAIGGEQASGIHGNKLKLRMICFLRGEQQHESDVGQACRRLEGDNAQQSAKQDTQVQAALGQILDDCATASTSTNGNQASDLREQCEKLSKKTLELQEATEELITFRKQLGSILQVNCKMEQRYITEAAKIIRKGGFGTGDEDWVQKMTTWYLDDIIAATGLCERNEPSPMPLPKWATDQQVASSTIPHSESGEATADDIINKSIYSGTFTHRSRLDGHERCWSAAGLAESQPPQWDTISAALVYVDKGLNHLNYACKACETANFGHWQLECGSII